VMSFVDPYTYTSWADNLNEIEARPGLKPFKVAINLLKIRSVYVSLLKSCVR